MTARDDEIRALLDRLAELAGDPTNLELRTAFVYYLDHQTEHGTTDTYHHYLRLVARIDDDQRRNRWCRHLANASGWDVRSVRSGANEYR